MGFVSSNVTDIKDKWVAESLGSIDEFWMMLGAEAFSRLMQPQKKAVVTSVLERGRFQKMMRDSKEKGLTGSAK